MSNADTGSEFQREFIRKLEMAVLSVLSIISLLLGYMIGSAATRAFSDSSIAVSLLLYLLLLALYPRYRFPFLAYMVGADVGSLVFDMAVLHAKVVIYPLVVLIVNDLGKFSVNIDFVQLLALLEVVAYIARKLRKAVNRKSGAS
ncbi:hypothetical protein [Acidilobus sp.]|uniref:hypothetical protein n=1 Tax=Acidilobus sp. TaxID=1872109 RepID=UPI003D049F30